MGWTEESNARETTWPVRATPHHLFSRYKNQEKSRFNNRGPGDEAQFIKELRKILPMTRRRQPQGERRRYWELPPLAEARKVFANYLNCDDLAQLWDEDELDDAASQ